MRVIESVVGDAVAEGVSGGVLVPTMGALHEGHDALIERAALVKRERGLGGPVVVSVFVNPAQFDEKDDYERYPRDVSGDAARAAAHGAEVVYAPGVDDVYPGGEEGDEMRREVRLPGCVVGKGMEDEYRPGHFEGVYRVCRRLFELVRPAAAVFGEKDWQQLLLVREMSAVEGLGVDVIGAATVRETGERAGLACSSRNVHLRGEDLEAALGLSRGIAAAQRVVAGGGSFDEAEAAARAEMERRGARVEYACVRDAATCGEPVAGRPARVLVAARVGTTRLIDNDALTPTTGDG